jgi:hypothetical protein
MAVVDHLVVAAASLDAGEAWLAATLGVPLQPGGQHPQMGTHNRLLRLDGRRYVEVIAVDPDQPAPAGRRWFGLDDAAVQAGLAAGPRLLAWVMATNDVTRAAARSIAPLGGIEAMTRGPFRWRLTVAADGSLPAGGALPLLIEWPPAGPHPADTLSDRHCRLQRLVISHPEPGRVAKALDAIGIDDTPGLIVIVGRAEVRLWCEIATPRGVVRLGAPEDDPRPPLVTGPA